MVYMLNISNLKDKWDDIMETTYGNFCVVAPRRSGKTTALVEKFISIPDSIFLFPTRIMLENSKKLVMERTEGIKRQYCISRMFTNMEYNSASTYNFFTFNTVFMDEIFSYKLSFDIMSECLGRGLRLITAGTPEIVLPYDTHNMSMIYFDEYVKQQINVFKGEGELFEI